MLRRWREFSQGSEEWLAWRDNGVGGSDYPCIVGTSEHANRYKLLGEKTGHLERKVYPPVVNAGHEAEPIIREHANRVAKVSFCPGCVEVEDTPFRSSLDGAAKYKGDKLIVLECKLVTPEALADMVMTGEHKLMHADQLNYNMAVSGADCGMLCCYDGESFWHSYFRPPPQEWIDYAFHAAGEFWGEVLAIRSGERSYQFDAITDLSCDYLDAVAEIDRAERKAAEIKDKIIKACMDDGRTNAINDYISISRDKRGSWRITKRGSR